VAKKTKTRASGRGASRKTTGRKTASRKTTSRKGGSKARPARRETKRKTTSRRTATVALAAESGTELRLASLRAQIERVLEKLDSAEGSEPGRYDDTRDRLKTWMADIDEICNPKNPDGCGPIMVFPS
jgi:hypothetical protein